MPSTSKTALFEAIPNISMGQKTKKFEQWVTAINQMPDVHILHTDSNQSANRTVVTMVGTYEGIYNACMSLYTHVRQWIDMKSQKGVHPRIGAVDVCPIVSIDPKHELTAVQLSHHLARKVSKKFALPVYMYEYSQTHTYRKQLQQIRLGEYEGLSEKMANPRWYPDYGPRKTNAEMGATVIGARQFLIAYNVNILTDQLRVVKRIAQRIRQSGYTLKRAGKTSRVPGLLDHVKAIGWHVESINAYQVSMNLVDFYKTGIHDTFEACKLLAQNMNTDTNGSELIGLIPKKALLDAGLYYQQVFHKMDQELSEAELMQLTVVRLGLDHFGAFELDDRILEYRIEQSGKF